MTMTDHIEVLSLRSVEKTYKQAGQNLNILHDLSLSVEKGEIVALVGPSGAGKSTLLHIAGLLDTPTGGEIHIGGQNVTRLNDRKRTLLRRTYIGFVYQFHYLLPEFSALENLILPQMIAGRNKHDAAEKGTRLLGQLGLSHRLDHRPARLSGGEQQRVAIARALINDPKLILADEPTGNLDPSTSADVFEMMLDLVREAQIGALIATHNMDLAEQMDRILELRGGRVQAY